MFVLQKPAGDPGSPATSSAAAAMLVEERPLVAKDGLHEVSCSVFSGTLMHYGRAYVPSLGSRGRVSSLEL